MDNYQDHNWELERPLSMGEWIITLIVLAIPCAGIIMMFVWSFGEGNISRRNYCRASLVFIAVGLVLALLLRTCGAG